MPEPRDRIGVSRSETIFVAMVLLASVAFHVWGVRVGWTSKNLPGFEFRQAQTALSSYFIKQENNFSFAYPTPVLGKPWSIPMEFPLYQWITVIVSNTTGLGLVKSGRLVSIACFYLTLPAVYLLLGRLGIAPIRRGLVLAVALTCPFYIFYTRGFLIETLALLASVWFLLAFLEAAERRSVVWLTLAATAGAVAALVKVTTFMLYCLPAAGWAAGRLWRRREGRRWLAEAVWMAAAVLPALALGWAWVHFADATKAQNPLAWFLSSEHLRGFNLGTWETRLSPKMWAMKGRIVTEALTSPLVLLGCALLAPLAARGRGREILACVAVFAAALGLFPELYALHDYYYAANLLCLVVAIGLVLVGLAESRAPRALLVIATLTILGGQVYRYFQYYYPSQKGISPGGDWLTQTVRDLTDPDDVIVIFGQDWNSMIPYYAQRRALMVREEERRGTPRLHEAMENLRNERVGALLVTDSNDHSVQVNEWFVDFGIDVRPLYRWRDVTVYVRADRRAESIRRLQNGNYGEIEWAPGAEPPPERLAGEWFKTASLQPYQREAFRLMTPQPTRFFCSFGPQLEVLGDEVRYNAHPVTRLVFTLPAGKHRLHTRAFLPDEAFDPTLPADGKSDGVEITLREISVEGDERVIFTRLLDPGSRPADRGWQPIDVEFDLAGTADVELFIGPGLHGRDTRDWLKLDRLVID